MSSTEIEDKPKRSADKSRQNIRAINTTTAYADDIKAGLGQIGSSSTRSVHPLIRASNIAFFDMVAVLLAFAAAYEVAEYLRSILLAATTSEPNSQSLGKVIFLLFIPTALLLILFSFWGHYNRRKPYLTEVREIYQGVMYSAAATTLLMFSLKMDFSRLWALSFFALLILFVPINRLASRKLLITLKIWSKPTIVIGDGPTAYASAKQFCEDKYLGLEVTDYIDISSNHRIKNLASLYRYGHSHSTESFGLQKERPHVVVAIENMNSLERHKKSFDIVMSACAAMTFIPPISGIPLYNSQLVQSFKTNTAVLRLHNNLKHQGAKILKRAMDLFFCALGLVLFSPVMLIVALAVKLDGGPIVFGQQRLGRDGKKFTCWKFRSMQVDADERLEELLSTNETARKSWEEDRKLKNDPRITRIGKSIRKTSLDELPQLWNVIKGEMSLIGPRPIVAAEIVKYGSSFDYYSECKPGITGLWQISGRNDTGYEERVTLDVWYVRNWSPWLDIVIGVKTIPILIFGKGAY